MNQETCSLWHLPTPAAPSTSPGSVYLPQGSSLWEHRPLLPLPQAQVSQCRKRHLSHQSRRVSAQFHCRPENRPPQHQINSPSRSGSLLVPADLSFSWPWHLQAPMAPGGPSNTKQCSWHRFLVGFCESRPWFTLAPTYSNGPRWLPQQGSL